MKKIFFKTSDGVTIIANWFPVENPQKYILLLHMMPATKESWNDFAAKLNEAEFSVLAIDLRGHGESTEDGKLGYKNFSDEEHQKYRLDVESALDFLKQKGARLENIYLCGASIGANLTIDFMDKYKEVEKGVALSAGLNYKGIETLPTVSQFSAKQNIYLAAAGDDARAGGPADEMAQQIYDATAGRKEIKIYETGGHGTDLFTAHPEFMEELINWLQK